MSEVTVPDLRNHGGHGIDPVTHGERITITRDARPVAELRPYTKSKVSTEALLTRWRHLPGSTPSPFGLTWTRFSTAGSDETALDRTRGVLDTSTVILLPGLSDRSYSWLSRS